MIWSDIEEEKPIVVGIWSILFGYDCPYGWEHNAAWVPCACIGKWMSQWRLVHGLFRMGWRLLNFFLWLWKCERPVKGHEQVKVGLLNTGSLGQMKCRIEWAASSLTMQQCTNWKLNDCTKRYLEIEVAVCMWKCRICALCGCRIKMDVFTGNFFVWLWFRRG